MVSVSSPENCVKRVEDAEASRGRRGAEACNRAWRQVLDRACDRCDVVGRRAAAAADDVHEAAAGELLQVAAGVRRPLVVFAERVRQAGVRIARDVTVGDARQLGDVRPHVARAQRAVDADAERPGVRDRDIEGVDRLPRQRAAAAVGDGDRDHQRQAHAALLEHLLDRDDARLRVERVDDRLEQQQIAAAVDQAAHLLPVGLAQLVEGHVAERRVVDVGRNRQDAVGRPHRAGDEARAVGRARRSTRPRPPSPAGRPRGSARRPGSRGRSRPAQSGCC